jgi:acyl phosphate:glycerol-3-phosphate acyltransferase
MNDPFNPQISRFVMHWITYWLSHDWGFIVAAFIIGSIPFGVVVSRVFFKTDIRAAGSGNIGAANALRTLGRSAGLAVLSLDVLKGVVATAMPMIAIRHHWVPFHWPVSFSGPDDFTPILGWLCGLAAIVGHCYSPLLGFKGGKGVATFLGVLIAGFWPSAVGFVAVWLVVVLVTGLAAVGSLLGTFAAVIILGYFVDSPTFYFTLPVTGLIVWKHRENIARLRHGTENRLQLLKR